MFGHLSAGDLALAPIVCSGVTISEAYTKLIQLSCLQMGPRGNAPLLKDTVEHIALLAHLLAGQTFCPYAVPLKAGTGYVCQVQAQDAPARSALLRNQAAMLMSHMRARQYLLHIVKGSCPFRHPEVSRRHLSITCDMQKSLART